MNYQAIKKRLPFSMLAHANLFEYYGFVLFNPPFTTAVSLGARFLWASCVLKSDLGGLP